MDQLSITYRNADDEVIPAPRPLFSPTKHKPLPGEDDFVLYNARKRRRLANAARDRQVRNHQKAYVNRELRKEREANQLDQLFNLHDRQVPAGPVMRNRAHNAILARVKYIRAIDQARYDKEWAARQKNRDLPAPSPVISHEEAWDRLRAVADTARRVVPKAPKYDRGGLLPSGLTVIRNNTGQPETVLGMTFDDLNEVCDDLGVSGDTPFRLFFDGQEFEVLSVNAHTGDATVHIQLQEA